MLEKYHRDKKKPKKHRDQKENWTENGLINDLT